MVWLVLAGTLAAQGPSGNDLYLRGRRAERAGHMAEAYLLYSQAAAMSPKNKTYWQRSQAVRTRAALEAKVDALGLGPRRRRRQYRRHPTGASPARSHAAEASKPANSFLPWNWRQSRGGRTSICAGMPKPCTKRSPKPSASIASSTTIFRRAPAPFRDAELGLPRCLARPGGGYRQLPRGPHQARLLVVKDTPQKRTEREPTAAIELHLPETTNPQDFNSIVTAVQQAFAIEKVAFDTQNNSVILRDRVSKVIPARLMFEDLSSPRAQVSIEVKFMEVSRNDAITYGVDLANTFSMVPLKNPYTLADLAHSITTPSLFGINILS